MKDGKTNPMIIDRKRVLCPECGVCEAYYKPGEDLNDIVLWCIYCGEVKELNND